MTTKNPTVITRLDANKITGYYYWYEFLKRSERYKKICQMIRADHPNSPPITGALKAITPKNKALKHSYFSRIYSRFTEDELDSIAIEENKMTLYDVISRIYPLFQDVFTNDFKEVEFRLKLLFKEADTRQLCAIQMGHDKLHESLYWHLYQYRNEHGKNPSIDEFLESYLDQQYNNGNEFCFINTNVVTRNDLSYIFKENLKFINISKKPLPKEAMEYSWAAFLLEGSIAPKSFKKILRAHDIHKESKTKEHAIATIFPNSTEDIATLEKNYYTLLAQAKQLILNAETGHFPGKFSNKPAQKPKTRGRYTVIEGSLDLFSTK